MRNPGSATGEFLLGQTRSRVLALLYASPELAVYLSEIARRVHTSVGTVRRELTALELHGLVLRRPGTSQVYYQANRDYPAFPELKALLAKTAGAEPLIMHALDPLRNKIQWAFLYGSLARGQETAGSDVDLLVAGSVSMDDLLDVLEPVARELRREINPSLYSTEELRSKLQGGHHLLKALQNGPLIPMIGNTDDFRAIR